MARRDPIEERLAHLAALRQEDDGDKVRSELEAALVQKRSGLLVAKAAELVAELGVDGLAEQMEGAFPRLLVDPLKRDKGCLAKTALAKALVELERPASEIFLAGVHYVQLEPVWGGSTDAASALRGWCAHGLVRMRHGEAMLEIAPLLVDPERPARIAAAEALGDSGQLAAEALLRLKIHSGDEEPEVVGECFTSLLRLEPERSLPFVGRFLADGDPAVAEGAALALGESRREEAIDLLQDRLEVTVDADVRRALYLALALTRRERAIDLLVKEVESGPSGRAAQALRALALHRFDDGLRERLRELVVARRDRVLEKVWEEELET